MSVAVDTTGTDFTFGPRTPVMDWVHTGLSAFGRGYDVAPDGERFLIVKAAGANIEGERPQIVIVQNWLEELERLAPTE